MGTDLDDVDGDAVCGDVDNCPTVRNPGQADSDGGGVAYTVTRLANTAIEDPDTLGGARALIVCDDCSTFVSFEGRSFPFYGSAQDSVYVSSNGYLGFPSGAAVGVLLADLDPPSNPAGYRANLLVDRFVVTWKNLPYFGGGGNVTFQLTLYLDSGVVDVNYDTLVGASYGTLGIGPAFVSDTGFDFAGMGIGASTTFGAFEAIGRDYSPFDVLAGSRFHFTSGDGRGDVCDPCRLDPLNDTDRDGVCGDVDECANSNLGLTVSIAGCDSGVSNTLFPTGCTLQDRINSCGVGVQNHGEFVSCVSQLTNDLKEQGVLTGRQKGRIQRCAARSNPHPAPEIIRVVHERP